MIFFCYKNLFLDYVMDDYYNRSSITSNVNFNNNLITDKTNHVTSNELNPVPVVRVVRKRTTANKKGLQSKN